MGVPLLKQSCCGCNLQTGSKIIGWLHLVFGIITLIVTCLLVSAGKYLHVQTRDGIVTIENPFYGLWITALIGAIISLIIAICLLYGSYKRAAGPTLAWVIYNVIGTTLFLIGSLYSCGTSFAAGLTGAGLGNLIGGLIGSAINIYLVIVVYSFYRELKEGPKNVATYNTA